MELHYETYGQGEPLVILHGLLGSLDNWHTISKRLGEQFSVFALDQRNHGRSGHSPEMNHVIMAEDVRTFIATHTRGESCVLGHSMGGQVAMQLALDHPAVVKKLIIVDIAPRAYDPRFERVLSGMASLDLSHFQTLREIEAALAPAVPDLATRQFLLKNLERIPQGGFRWRIGLQEIKSNYRRLIEPISSQTPFTKPTLFIRGDKSDFLLESDWESIRILFPQAILRTITGAGHLVHAEKPQAFLEVTREFLLSA